MKCLKAGCDVGEFRSTGDKLCKNKAVSVEWPTL